MGDSPRCEVAGASGPGRRCRMPRATMVLTGKGHRSRICSRREIASHFGVSPRNKLDGIAAKEPDLTCARYRISSVLPPQAAVCEQLGIWGEIGAGIKGSRDHTDDRRCVHRVRCNRIVGFSGSDSSKALLHYFWRGVISSLDLHLDIDARRWCCSSERRVSYSVDISFAAAE